MVVVVDYGMGNVGSIVNMFKKAGLAATVTADRDKIRQAQGLVLPGVGSFDAGMNNLRQRQLVGPLNEMVIDKKVPVLGICLGMQLFTRASEEGSQPGLGWIDAVTTRFQFESPLPPLKVPHMGWNGMVAKSSALLFGNLPREARFYFAHSYHVLCNRQEDIAAVTVYGYQFVSAVERHNVFGVQFHPEKSHKFGLQLLENFGRLTARLNAVAIS